MPQDYKNSPRNIQKYINIALNELIDRACFLYIADIMIFGKYEAEDIINLKLV